MLSNADCEIKQEARLVIEADASVCIAIPMPTLFQDSILAKQAHYLDPKVASHSNTKGRTWTEYEISRSTPSKYVYPQ